MSQEALKNFVTDSFNLLARITPHDMKFYMSFNIRSIWQANELKKKTKEAEQMQLLRMGKYQLPEEACGISI